MIFVLFVAVVVQQPTPSTGPKFRDLPVVMTDSDGNAYTTELRYVNGLLMWVAVGITCFVAGQSLTTCTCTSAYTCIIFSQVTCTCSQGWVSFVFSRAMYFMSVIDYTYMYDCL